MFLKSLEHSFKNIKEHMLSFSLSGLISIEYVLE